MSLRLGLWFDPNRAVVTQNSGDGLNNPAFGNLGPWCIVNDEFIEVFEDEKRVDDVVRLSFTDICK